MTVAKAKQLAAMRDSATRWFLAQQLAEEEARQGRPLTKNERMAFKAGLYRGMNFDVFDCLDAAYSKPPAAFEVDTMANEQELREALVAALRKAAQEIANANLFGWGNVCTDAADYIERFAASPSLQVESAALQDVAAERQRQQTVEGWRIWKLPKTNCF